MNIFIKISYFQGLLKCPHLSLNQTTNLDAVRQKYLLFSCMSANFILSLPFNVYVLQTSFR